MKNQEPPDISPFMLILFMFLVCIAGVFISITIKIFISLILGGIITFATFMFIMYMERFSKTKPNNIIPEEEYILKEKSKKLFRKIISYFVILFFIFSSIFSYILISKYY